MSSDTLYLLIWNFPVVSFFVGHLNVLIPFAQLILGQDLLFGAGIVWKVRCANGNGRIVMTASSFSSSSSCSLVKRYAALSAALLFDTT